MYLLHTNLPWFVDFHLPRWSSLPGPLSSLSAYHLRFNLLLYNCPTNKTRSRPFADLKQLFQRTPFSSHSLQAPCLHGSSGHPISLIKLFNSESNPIWSSKWSLFDIKTQPTRNFILAATLVHPHTPGMFRHFYSQNSLFFLSSTHLLLHCSLHHSLFWVNRRLFYLHPPYPYLFGCLLLNL